MTINEELSSETDNAQLLDLIECVSIYGLKVEDKNSPYNLRCMSGKEECLYRKVVGNEWYCQGEIETNENKD